MRPNTTHRKHTQAEPGFSLSLQNHENALLLRLSGSIDIGHCEAFERAVMRLAHLMQDTVILDLSGLRFINVIGLGVIVQLGNALRQRGGSLTLTGANRNICLLIHRLRLHELFPPKKSIASADTETEQALAICA